MIIYVFALSLLKLLLLPSYRSTDFEVHRNWLAITHSLPISEWYKEDTSEWTLDYPPLFAWFECLLAKFAYYFDPHMLVINNLNYASNMTIFFQRLSVIITDLLFAYAIHECIGEIKRETRESQRNYIFLFLIIFGNAGLLMVDHIHFQYNGFLFGIMFLSIARILQRREVEGAFWFCILLNLKHIYLYIAPAYFIYLLRSFCFSSGPEGSIKWLSLSFKRLFSLAAIVITVFALSLGPFIAMGQLHQVFSRLFPFKRGLTHAYWAPNFWAFYNFVDKISKVVGIQLGIVTSIQQGSMTSGLVQEYQHSVLPSVTPAATFGITFISMLPSLIYLWRTPHDPWQFVRTVTMCGFCSFLFGWHVHEKAILMVILPLSLQVFMSKTEARYFLFLSIIANFSLFPLIFTHHETVIKVTSLLLHASVTYSTLKRVWSRSDRSGLSSLLRPLEIVLLIGGLLPIFVYEQIIQRWFKLNLQLPFLVLMLTSVYCSIGVIYVWFGLYYRSFEWKHYSVKWKRRGSSKAFAELKGGTNLNDILYKTEKKSLKNRVKSKNKSGNCILYYILSIVYPDWSNFHHNICLEALTAFLKQ